MNTLPASWIVLAGILIVALFVAAFWTWSRRKQQTRRLQQRFGPEYGRTIDELGGLAKAESELKAREKRVEQLSITALAPAEATRFRQAWNAMQSRFVDNPKGVVVQADLLVRELMQKRGYSTGDFERQAADISVDHSAVVEAYRAAQAIAIRDQRGEADTEELRIAVVHYHALFDELLEIREATEEVPAPGQLPVHS
jgi:FtsZ-interacting cell division protein ZipA